MDYPGINYQGLAPYSSDEVPPLNVSDTSTPQYKKMESEYNKSTETFGQKEGVQPASGKKKSYDSEDELLERGNWTGKLDFILALIGFSVGLGNVWRFPYLCYKNGGGAFLIPYFLCLGLGGIPLLILEIGFGQFTSQGGVTSWNTVPLFKGIGGANVVILTFLNTYYTVIMAWALYYMIMSFNSVVPWSKCDNEWNTEYCFIPGVDQLKNCTNVTSDDITTEVSATLPTSDITEFGNATCIDPSLRVSSTVEFWERKILQIHLSSGIDDLGGINWQLTLCLIASWVLVYLCICKGVKSSGKVVYFTAPFPYVLLTILLVRAVTLENAVDGIIFYLKPDLSKLSESQVWLDAATQIFFSYSLGLGTMVALGSYNKYKHNFVRDAVLFACANSGTSIYAGIVIFSVLGFMAANQNKEISEVADSGPGLAFVAYPEGLAQMPGAPIWSVMFFLMLILLGIDSEFVGVEGFVTAIVDMFPFTFRRGNRREIFAAVTCACYCVFGICMTTYGGMYIFQLFDYYSASGSTLLWITTFEAVAIGWVYGAKKLSSSFYEMSGWKMLNPYLYVSWKFLTPMFTAAVFIFSLVKYEPLKYNDEYVYPTWGYVMGWLMAAASMVVPPGFIVYKLVFATHGSFSERWKTATTSKLRPRVEYVIPPEVNSVESPYSIEMDGSNCVQTPPPSYPEVASGDSTKF